MSDQPRDVADLVRLLARLRGDAESSGEPDVDTAVLATVGSDGRPGARTINLHITADDQLLFFTSRRSGKGLSESSDTPVSLCIYWKASRVQVTLGAIAHELPDDEADAVWSGRDRERQLLAYVSSLHPDAEPEAFAQAVERTRDAMSFDRVPRPDDWAAYVLSLERVVIWRAAWAHAGRRHIYTIEDGVVTVDDAPGL